MKGDHAVSDQLLRTFFNLIMGWTRDIMAWFWRIFDQKTETNFQDWFQQNWVRFVLLICVICTVVDLLVYLFRWRPLRVWASFFRRMFHKDESKANDAALNDQDEDLFEQQTDRKDIPLHEYKRFREPGYPPDDTGAKGYVQRSDRYPHPGPASEKEYDSRKQQPDYQRIGEKERNTNERTTISEDEIRKEHIDAIRQTHKRFQWSELLGNGDMNENEIAYRRPDPVFDKQRAYREPVFPDKWHDQESLRRSNHD